MTKVIVTTELA